MSYDYSSTPVYGSVTIDDVVYPFSIYPELYQEDDDQLDFTGNAYVVAITPTGTVSFTLWNDNEMLEEDDVNKLDRLPAEFASVIKNTFEQLKPH